jgi:hypothetical protein
MVVNVVEYGRISTSKIPIRYLRDLLEHDILPYSAGQNNGRLWQNTAEYPLPKNL